MSQNDKNVNKFLDLVKRSQRGKFKIYLGMIAGVGKTYRMLKEARHLLENNIDVQIGYIETHNRAETHKLLEGIPIIPRKKIFYKGKEIEEMDLQTILNIHPKIVIVDELAHTNIPGSKNEKRWQDVLELLEANINVISAVNIQHIESINKDVETITGIEVQERIPDTIISYADEIVNIDLPAGDLLERLKSGKIYDKSKVATALNNFFQEEKILQLRELALKEVALHVGQKVDNSVSLFPKLKEEKLLCCISTNYIGGKKLIRKASRIANLSGSVWKVLFVQNPNFEYGNIEFKLQRQVDDNFKLASGLGAEIIIVKSDSIPDAIIRTIDEGEFTILVIGKPELNIFTRFIRNCIYDKVISQTINKDITIITL